MTDHIVKEKRKKENKGRESRKIIMNELGIPKNYRSSFIRFCNRGYGDYYERQGHFWNDEKKKFGEYAPVNERSRVYRSIESMWNMYKKIYKNEKHNNTNNNINIFS